MGTLEESVTLAARLTTQIRSRGPIPLSDFMAACLFDPEDGFYRRQSAIGRNGAFTTAPEISQMFGEIIGAWLVKTWQDQGRPSPIALVELGPGHGTMMSDILRTVSHCPEFCRACCLFLVETSTKMRAVQRKKLSTVDPVWIEDIGELPDLPLFLVANEFFDALPIRQFRRTKTGWNEIRVGIDRTGLVLCETPCGRDIEPRERDADTIPGDIVEIRPASLTIAAEISKTIREFGGTALIIDYGAPRSLGQTLQAVKNHRFTNPLAEPGEADISAHVDFGAIRHAAQGVSCSALLNQGVWLELLGITERARILARNLSGESLRQHQAAHRRLTHPDEMGSLFKVMSLYPSEMSPPPGFS